MTAIHDLAGIEVEHLLGGRHGPLVTIRCQSTAAVLHGQVTPAQAREIAGHLMESAARAEYEADLYQTMKADGWEDDMIGAIFTMVRRGETTRHTSTPPEGQ